MIRLLLTIMTSAPPQANAGGMLCELVDQLENKSERRNLSTGHATIQGVFNT